MIRTQVYLTKEQAKDIKLRAKREDKYEADVIREFIDKGRKGGRRPVPAPLSRRSTGPAAFGGIRARIGLVHRPKRVQPATYRPGHLEDVG